MSASVEEVLDRLSTKNPVRINSTAALVADTNKAAAAIDRQRARKQDQKEPSVRKPGLGAVTSAGVVYRRPLGDLVLRLCGEFGGQGGVVGF